jgi:hypothetical protein
MNGYWVYLIAPETGWPVKVGYGKNLVTRLGQLQVGCWETLRVQKKYHVPNKSAAMSMERLIHKKLDQLNKRKKGEWFNLFVDDAIIVVEEAFDYQKKLAELKDKDNWDEEKASYYGYIELG